MNSKWASMSPNDSLRDQVPRASDRAVDDHALALQRDEPPRVLGIGLCVAGLEPVADRLAPGREGVVADERDPAVVVAGRGRNDQDGQRSDHQSFGSWRRPSMTTDRCRHVVDGKAGPARGQSPIGDLPLGPASLKLMFVAHPSWSRIDAWRPHRPDPRLPHPVQPRWTTGPVGRPQAGGAIPASRGCERSSSRGRPANSHR